MFFIVAVCLSVSLVLASGGKDGLGISSGEAEEGSHSSSCDSCCSSDYSTVRQSHQLLTNGDNQFSMGDKVSSSSGDITMSIEFIENATCGTTWFIPRKSSNGSISCECSSSLDHIIECDIYSGKVSLLKCYCMTFRADGSMIIVGQCPYGCVSIHMISIITTLSHQTPITLGSALAVVGYA